MSNDSPPGSFRKTPGGEFTWPPSREELDAIEVIPLHDAAPIAVVPAKAPARAIVAPVVQRRGRLPLPVRMPRREDLVYAGVLCTSLLAIAVAATMQFSDVWSPAPEHAAPVQSAALVQAARPVQTEPSKPDARPIAVPPSEALTAEALTAEALPVMTPIAAAPLAHNVAEVRPRTTSRAAARRPAPAPASRSAAHARRSAAYARPASYSRRAEPVDITRPRLISPEGGRRGKLVLLVEVKKNGKVGDVDVLSSDLDRKNRSHRDLQRAAISTVKRWRYEPAIRDGAPADTQVRVVVNIDLDSSRAGFTEANARRRAMAANRAADSVLAAR